MHDQPQHRQNRRTDKNPARLPMIVQPRAEHRANKQTQRLNRVVHARSRAFGRRMREFGQQRRLRRLQYIKPSEKQQQRTGNPLHTRTGLRHQNDLRQRDQRNRPAHDFKHLAIFFRTNNQRNHQRHAD